MVLPSFEIVGHSTRPSLKFVSAFAAGPPAFAAAVADQRFCAPLRSDMKNSVLPSALHIGHASFAPPLVTGSYDGPLVPVLTSQISLSSRWL